MSPRRRQTTARPHRAPKPRRRAAPRPVPAPTPEAVPLGAAGNRLAVAPEPRRSPLRLPPGPQVSELAPEQRRRLEEILARSPRRRLDGLIDSPDAAALVPAIPPDEFAATLLDVGLGDGEALLTLAADPQLVHLVDVTAWTSDELDIASALETLDVLRSSDPELPLHWLRATDDSAVLALFAKL